MAFNWTEVLNDLDTDVFKEMGYEVKLIKADENESSAKAWAVDDVDEKTDTPQGPSRNTLTQKKVLISGSIKKIPEVGDILVKDKVELVIADVEETEPSSKTLLYRVTLR